MIIPSGSKHEEPGIADTPPVVPLAELPLVADHQQTVVTSKTDSTDSSVTAVDSVNVEYLDPGAALFAEDGSDSVPGPVRLEHFEIRRRIGSGGMGKVFLAEDMTLRRPVALKVLNPGSAAEPALLARFQNEARSAALLRHDNIAQVYYTGSSQGVHFIAGEYIAGRTVRDLIEEYEVLPTDVVMNYAVQATLALNHMYAAGVVHRDIKPSNIIVSNEGRVKIVDMGLARRDSPDSICDITVAGSTLGTFDYLAPEQARDPRQADVRSDIYSLGCTLYHMLTGQPPYPEGTALQKLLDHQGKQAPDPAHINSQVSDDIADIVLTMMNTDPADRYQTPGELLSELIEVATNMGLQGVPADGVVWQHHDESGVRQFSGAIVLLALVAVLCATAATLHFSNTDISPDTRVNLPVNPIGPGIVPVVNPPVTEDSGEEETDDTPPVPEPELPNAFIVHSPNDKPQGYKTLSEALEHPRERTEIELTFDGSAPFPSKRLPRLDRQTVHLYAAEGVHPVLEFRGIRNVADATSLFTLINSNLTLEGISIRLVPEGDASESVWSVFDCSGSTFLDLRKCSIDIVDPDETPVEICRLKESTSDKESQHKIDVHLTDVVVRGHADMFHVETQSDGQIRMENCGFGLAGHLIHNTGSASMNGPGSLDVLMEHVTCVLNSPLIRIVENEFLSTRQMISDVRVTSRASVFCSAADDGTLIVSRGNGLLDDLRDLLNWNGDTNLYSGYEFFWKMRIPNSYEADLADLENNLDEWKYYWNNQRSEAGENNAFIFDWQDAAWKSDLDDVNESSPLNHLQPDWLRLDATQFTSTGDLPYYLNREVPGVIFRRLPEFQKLPAHQFDDEENPEPSLSDSETDR